MKTLQESILDKDFDIDDDYVLAAQHLEEKINKLIKYADSKKACDINKIYSEVQKYVANVGKSQAQLFTSQDAFRYGQMIKISIYDQTQKNRTSWTGSGASPDKVWAYRVDAVFIDEKGGNIMCFELYYDDDMYRPVKRNQKGIVYMSAYGGHPAHLMGGIGEDARKAGKMCLLSNESLKKTIKKQARYSY